MRAYRIDYLEPGMPSSDIWVPGKRLARDEARRLVADAHCLWATVYETRLNLDFPLKELVWRLLNQQGIILSESPVYHTIASGRPQ